MKWFKHFTNDTQNPGVSRLLDKLGVEGYGRYYLLVTNLTGAADCPAFLLARLLTRPFNA